MEGRPPGAREGSRHSVHLLVHWHWVLACSAPDLSSSGAMAKELLCFATFWLGLQANA